MLTLKKKWESKLINCFRTRSIRWMLIKEQVVGNSLFIISNWQNIYLEVIVNSPFLVIRPVFSPQNFFSFPFTSAKTFHVLFFVMLNSKNIHQNVSPTYIIQLVINTIYILTYSSGKLINNYMKKDSLVFTPLILNKW